MCSFVKNKKPNIMKKREIIYLIVIIGLLATLYYVYTNKQDATVNYNALNKHLIPKEYAIGLQKNFAGIQSKYLDSQLKMYSNNPNFEETQFVWFPLEVMESYVNLIGKIKDANPDEEVSGIRFYFMRYPNRDSYEYKAQQSVFMVPTIKEELKNNTYEAVNHLPFTLNSSNEIEIIEGLLENYRGAERLENFKKRTAEKKQQASLLPASIALFKGEGTTLTTNGTVLNEGEAYPPPPNNLTEADGN